jgi:hypothetical protein
VEVQSGWNLASKCLVSQYPGYYIHNQIHPSYCLLYPSDPLKVFEQEMETQGAVVHHCNQPHHNFHLHEEEHRYLLEILLVEVHKLLVMTVGPLVHGSKEVDTCLKEVEEHCQPPALVHAWTHD